MHETRLAKLYRAALFRKLAIGPFLRVAQSLWKRLPPSLLSSRPVISCGLFLHSLVQLSSNRTQFHGTFFLRNRPELEAIRSLAERKPKGSTVKLVILACSNGAEVYSILWTIRSARPDLQLEAFAIDISEEVIRIAKEGVYSMGENALVHEHILARLSEQEMAALFDKEGDLVRVKRWIANGIQWLAGDAGDPKLAKLVGPADIVVANKFLCHMAPPEAETCLRNVCRFVKSGGYLLVSGVDVDVRAKVATDLGWRPVLDHIEDIHNGDPSVRRDWPWRYWGLEPFDAKRPDWQMRYAAIFQLGSPTATQVPAQASS